MGICTFIVCVCLTNGGLFLLMIPFWKRMARWMSVSLSSLFLLFLLTACGGGSSNAATPTPIPPTPPPTPTTAPSPSTQFQTYTGTGFTIEYPQGWKAQSNQGGIVFTDAQQINTMTVLTVPNPGGTVSAAQELKLGLPTIEKSFNVSNVQPVSMPATRTVGGETWAQSGITGTVTKQGVAVPGELIGLADNHPANSPATMAYEIYYAGPSLAFQQEDAQFFQPMLQSFKFTA